MLVSTPGIVMHATKYGDTSLIVKIFTQQQGNQSFIIKGAFRKNNRFSASYFTPLAMMDISYDDHSKGSLKYLKDIVPHQTSKPLFYDPAKNSILLFYNEILYKMLMDAGEDKELFGFLQKEIDQVNNASGNIADLPLRFLLRLCKVMGYFPEDNYSTSNCYFYMPECRFQSYYVENAGFMNGEESEYLHQMLSHTEPLSVSRGLRVSLLKQLVAYLQMHNEQIHKIDSLEILSSILH